MTANFRMPIRIHSNVSKQQGVALVFALVFLVMLSLMAVTATQVTTLEERMAGNTRDRDLGLEAAEAALREAEQRIANDPGFRLLSFQVDVNDDNKRGDWVEYFEDNDPGASPTDGLMAINTSYVGRTFAQPVIKLENYCSSASGGICDPGSLSARYRITASAQGSSEFAVVILQSEVKCTVPDADADPSNDPACQ